jgi:hypothetical protein
VVGKVGIDLVLEDMNLVLEDMNLVDIVEQLGMILVDIDTQVEVGVGIRVHRMELLEARDTFEDRLKALELDALDSPLEQVHLLMVGTLDILEEPDSVVDLVALLRVRACRVEVSMLAERMHELLGMLHAVGNFEI